MTSLFDATQNPLFRLICALVNEIHAGAELSRENKILDAVFQFPPPERFAKLRLELPVPPLICAAEKFPVSELDAARLSNEFVPPDLSDRLQDFYRQHTVELSLRLRNRLNAVERCFALFGSCDKSSRYNKDDDTYFLTVTTSRKMSCWKKSCRSAPPLPCLPQKTCARK